MQLDKELLAKLSEKTLSLDEISSLERGIQFPKFNDQVAFQLGCFVRDKASELYPDKAVAINISLMSGQRLFRANSNEGVALDNDNWIRRKENTVKRFGFSTYYIHVKKGDLDFEKKFYQDTRDYAFHGGAVPLYLVNCPFPFAILTCSGLKQEEDHLLVITCLKAFIKNM